MSTFRRSKRPLPSRVAFYVLLFALSLLAASSLWGPGMVNTRGGGDSPFLLWRTVELAESLRHGDFPPRWMAHAAYDLGYPFFNHYAALPYYFSAGLTALGLSPILAIQATQTLGFLLAALTMALWARRIYRSRWAAALAVVAYTFAPFHLVNVYVRGDSLSEFYAFVWYPLILWALDRLVERPTWRRVVAAALAYGALILTHNVSALIFSPFALLYALVLQLRRPTATGEFFTFHAPRITPHAPRPAPQGSRFTFYLSRITQHALRIALPFLLGILLTAWFWLPAIGETGYGQLGPDFTEGYFHYENHFRGRDLVQSSFAFDYRVAPSAKEAGPFAMGVVQALLALLGAGYCVLRIPYSVSRKRERTTQYALRSTHCFFILFALALSTFMITPLSRLLWERLPLLATTQFPWRFLSVQALFTAVVTGNLAEPWKDEDGKEPSRFTFHVSRLIFLIAAVALVLAALLGLQHDRLPITAEDVTWDNLLLYEAFTGNIGTTIRYEYLPQDVVPRLYVSDSVVDGVGAFAPLAANGVRLNAELLEREPERQRWRVELEAPASVTFPLNWWPGWQARVDGEPVETRPVLGSGRLQLDLEADREADREAGSHSVLLRLRPTALRRGAFALSLVTLLLTALLLGLNPDAPAAPTRGRARLALYPLVVALLTSLLLPALFTAFARLPDSPATFFDFIQRPYPHRGPVEFGDLARLEEVEAPATAAPGVSLDVTLDWQVPAGGPLTATLSLVSPAAPRHGVPYTLAARAFPLPAEGTARTRLSLALPEDLPRGLYLLELRLYQNGQELFGRTTGGGGMGPLYVGAVRVPEGPPLPDDAPELARLGNGELLLHAVEAEQVDPTLLVVRPTWSTPGTSRNWSLSLRLLDASGRQWVQWDQQPGYGYLPTTLWRPGEGITDRITLPLPEGLAPGDYTLRIVTYLASGLEGGGEVDVPVVLDRPHLLDLRESCCELERKGGTLLCQGEGVALTGLELPAALPEGESLAGFAEWNAVQAPEVDLAVRWEALAPEGEVVGRAEGPVAAGSRTSSWPRHTWVRAPLHLELPPVLDAESLRLRVTLLAGGDEVTSCDLEREIPVQQRARSFEAPALPYPQPALFGEEIRLLGYDFEQREGSLLLTLWWQAERPPVADYKRFVHLYAPATVAVAQDDAMPRAWSYPTSWWQEGEVVSETVTLDLAGVPAGTYGVAVGWYLPETAVRLPTLEVDDRVVLQELEVRLR